MIKHPGLNGYISYIFGFINVIYFLKLFSIFSYVYKIIYPSGYIRVINYHSTPRKDYNTLLSHFEFYKKFYSNSTIEDLIEFLKNGKWHKSKPGLIITFDDGIRNNFDVAASLLDRFGFTGIFFIPTGFIDSIYQIKILQLQIKLMLVM